MSADRRWRAALAEHQRELDAFLDVVRGVDATAWAEPRAQNKWSPAAVVLHVCRAYELGRDAAKGKGVGMKLLVTPRRATLLRSALLPVIVSVKRFPRGVPAPREVRPDVDEASRLTRDVGLDRLRATAGDAARALYNAALAHPDRRVPHAYFGPLQPRLALRLLSAHTHHHARLLARPAPRR